MNLLIKLLELMLEKTMNNEFKGNKPFWALLSAAVFLVAYWRLPDLLLAISSLK